MTLPSWWTLARLRAAVAFDRLWSTPPATDGAAQTQTFMLEAGGTVAGRYKMTRVLGEGGMGRVWMAEDEVEKRNVALKEMRMPPGMTPAEQEQSALLFRKEFFAMKKLQHPNTVRVFDAGQLETGDRFITMEVVDGSDLESAVKKRRMSSEETYAILIQLAQVLSFIHSRFFVHCDIKAENIRITPDKRVKLMDFGLMHQLGLPSKGLKGTPAYMAPEWPQGGVIDARTDLYSLGVLGFFLVTGKLPFRGKNLAEMLDAHLRQEPPKPSLLASRIDPALEAILLRLLSKAQRDRPASAADLAEELAAASGKPLTEEPLSARASYLHVAELVGRAGDAKVLDDALGAAVDGHARALLVGAAAGVGKSRLLQEFELKAKVADIPFGLGQCRPEGLSPLAPLKQALLALMPVAPAALMAEHGPMLRKVLPSVAGGGTPPKFTDPAKEKMAILETLSAWTRGIAAVRPFVLCLEDVHWSDQATIEYVNVIIRALQGTRGLVVLTYRSDELSRLSAAFQTVDEGVADRLELKSLDGAAVETLLGAVLPGLEPPKSFVDRLLETTKGNAFFLLECLRSFVEGAVLERKRGRWSSTRDLATLPLPDGVNAVVSQRLATVPAEHLELFRRLAPAGRALEMSLIHAVGGVKDDKLFAALDDGVERQLLQSSEGKYWFSHEIMRAVIYETTPAPQKAEFHGAIARHLEATHGTEPDMLRQIGYHHSRSTTPDKAIPWLLKAGDHALANKALLEATLLLKEAANLFDLDKQGGGKEHPEREAVVPGLYAKLVEIGFSGHPPSCIEFSDRLFAHWQPLIEEGSSRVTPLLSTLDVAAERKKALGKLVREIPVKEKMAPEDAFLKRAELRVLQGVALAATGQAERVNALAAAVDAEQPPGSPFRAASVLARGILSFHLGRFDLLPELKARHRALADISQELQGLPRRLSWALGLHGYLVNMYSAQMGLPLDDALTVEGLEIADRLAFNDLRFHQLNSRLVRGCFSGSAAVFGPNRADADDLIRRLGTPRLLDKNLSLFLPIYYLERRELEHAAASVEKLTKLVDLIPTDLWLKLYAQVSQACLLAHTDKAKALVALPAAVDAASAAGFRLQTYARASYAQLLAGTDKEAARVVAEAAVARATDAVTASPFDEIVARRALAAAVPARARDELTRAAEVARVTTSLPLQEGICCLELARATVADDRAAAAASVERAEALFTACGAPHWIDEVAAFRRQAAAK